MIYTSIDIPYNPVNWKY